MNPQQLPTPTPETDALFSHYLKYEPWTNKPIFDLARKLERERDNAITDAKQFEVDCIRALKERNEARAQRDQLAAALRDILNAESIHPESKP